MIHVLVRLFRYQYKLCFYRTLSFYQVFNQKHNLAICFCRNGSFWSNIRNWGLWRKLNKGGRPSPHFYNISFINEKNFFIKDVYQKGQYFSCTRSWRIQWKSNKGDQHSPLYFKTNYINECTYIIYDVNQK